MDKALGDTPYARITALMERLRKDCPWDSAQSFASIAPYTIEEAYEVKDAIDRADMRALREELGDLLFQVLFHAHMASEIEAFDFDDVCEALVTKMVRRHPHIFDDPSKDKSPPPDWETLKQKERLEKGERGTLDGVAQALPALIRAQKLQKRAAKTGFDWPNIDGVYAKLNEEIAEVEEAVALKDSDKIEDEIGDLLFSVVNLARHLGVNSESALRRANEKFTRRFNAVEVAAGADLRTMDIEALEQLWQAVKATEKSKT